MLDAEGVSTHRDSDLQSSVHRQALSESFARFCTWLHVNEILKNVSCKSRFSIAGGCYRKLYYCMKLTHRVSQKKVLVMPRKNVCTMKKQAPINLPHKQREKIQIANDHQKPLKEIHRAQIKLATLLRPGFGLAFLVASGVARDYPAGRLEKALAEGFIRFLEFYWNFQKWFLGLCGFDGGFFFPQTVATLKGFLR